MKEEFSAKSGRIGEMISCQLVFRKLGSAGCRQNNEGYDI